jgi:hypothetical protein
VTAATRSLHLSDHDRAAELQRRQVQLAVAAAAVFVFTLALIVVALRSGAHEPVHYVFNPSQGRVRPRVTGTTSMIVAIGAGLTATFALLLVLVVHALRVATFALRKEVH